MITELNIQIEDLIQNNANDFEISKLFKTAIKEYISSTKEITETTVGKNFFITHTKKIDTFIIMLYKYILRKNFGNFMPMSNSIPITLVALGSYGREQLCVYSDIDLMILYQDVKGYNIKPIIEELLTLAWDSGLKLGHRVHELSEIENVVKEDITIKSSILESRQIYGSSILWFSYQNVLRNVRKTNQKEFILEKLNEHKQRLLKYPLTMEPNIKDGYGGMREANVLFWMANVIFGVTSLKQLIDVVYTDEEYKKYRSSLEFIFQTRNVLHVYSNKKQDIVNFDILPELSEKLGFKDKQKLTKERQYFSKLLDSLHAVHFFTSVMTKKIIRTYLADYKNIKELRNSRYKKNFYILNNKLYASFHTKPITLINLIKFLVDLPNNIFEFDRSFIYFASNTKVPSKQSKELKAIILKLLLTKDNLYPILKLIYNSNLFQAVIPSTKKIINQPQFDGYHKHPVDIHSLKTIYHIENIKDEFVKDIYNSFSDTEKGIAKLAALFHDIGKGRGTDHHVTGEIIFKKFARSFGMSEESMNLCARLIRYHNMMSMVATREDIYSQKVILNFTGLLKTELTLKMLFPVTYADISSVGVGIYKSSTATLLRELYTQSILAFNDENLVNESSRRIAKQNAIKRLKAFKDLEPVIQKKIMKITSNQIFLQLKSDELLNIGIWAKDIETFDYKIENQKNATLKIDIVRKIPLNLGHLLGKLQFLNIVSMNIFKLYDDKKIFQITYSESVEKDDLLYIEDVIKKSFDMNIKSRIKKPKISKKEVEINCNHTEYLAQMKIDTKDQQGLFSYIAQVFDDFGIDIESAKVHTSRGRARDLFLIEKNGNFCDNKEKILDLICED